MKPQLSIIMPHYNDVETTIGTIESLYDTIDIDKFELIVVNDGSRFAIPDSYKWRANAKYVSNFINMGVGQAFDIGVRVAKSDNLILMGADIRFEKNGWADRMLSVINKHPKALIATTCGSTTNKNTRYYGADVMFLVSNDDLGPGHPRKHIIDYKSVLEGKWRLRTGRGVYQVPCLMGAFYGVTKEWYNFVRGFELHYKWGVLEPYISLKSWSLGGEVLVDTENKVNHIFNRKPQREALWDILIYNELMTAGIVFNSYGIKYANYLYESRTSAYELGSRIYMDKIESINQMCTYINENRVIEPKELEEKMVAMSYHYNKDGNKYEIPLAKDLVSLQ